MEEKIVIRVCDDDPFILREISRIVKKYLKKEHMKYKMACFTSGQEFFQEYWPEGEELIFLDIDMPGMTGGEIAEKLEEYHASKKIIFVTGYDNLIIDNLRHRPFQFIQKSAMEDEIPEALEKYFSQYQENRQEISVKTETGFWVLRVQEICYLECANHTVTIYTNSGETIRLRSSLKEWEEKLAGSSFFRVHKGFLANIKNIRMVQGGCLLMKNGVEIPLSRGKSEEVKKRMILLMR